MGRSTSTLGRLASLAALVLLVGCGSNAPRKDEAATKDPAMPYDGYPDSIVALGHSGSTGVDSDPAKPGVEVRSNSWVTGTNPAVNSLYGRILDANPGIEGKGVSLSQNGATVTDLLGQAEVAVSIRPRNPLVVIQIMDNDIACPATARDYDSFEAKLREVLRTLDHGLPTSRIFVVSQFGSPSTYWQALTPEERVSIGGTGPCAFLDPGGRLVRQELDRLEETVHAYEGRLRVACLTVDRCRFDDGAFGEIVDRPEHLTADLNHLTVQGHAVAAEVAWTALQGAGVVPTQR